RVPIRFPGSQKIFCDCLPWDLAERHKCQEYASQAKDEVTLHGQLLWWMGNQNGADYSGVQPTGQREVVRQYRSPGKMCCVARGDKGGGNAIDFASIPEAPIKGRSSRAYSNTPGFGGLATFAAGTLFVSLNRETPMDKDDNNGRQAGDRVRLPGSLCGETVAAER